MTAGMEVSYMLGICLGAFNSHIGLNHDNSNAHAWKILAQAAHTNFKKI